jgi:hypothetical protein
MIDLGQNFTGLIVVPTSQFRAFTTLLLPITKIKSYCFDVIFSEDQTLQKLKLGDEKAKIIAIVYLLFKGEKHAKNNR